MRDKFAATVDVDEFFNVAHHLLKLRDRNAIYLYLDIFRSSKFLNRIYDDTKWPEIVLKLLSVSNFTFPRLFQQRRQKYPEKTLFTLIKGKSITNLSWEQTGQQIDKYAKGLISLIQQEKKDIRIAFFCKNSIEIACLDLACLNTGLVNIMIPANSVPTQIEYILNITDPLIMIFDDLSEAENLFNQISRPKNLKHLVFINQANQIKHPDLTLKSLVQSGNIIRDEKLDQKASAIKFGDLISIMFTSGTTGNPKGIMFSHQNVVFKRFARAMALPEIGEEDIFLCYLPLYHTFGRWLEMTGCIFWNARYVFMENPSLEAMIDNMKRIKPSVFISIPKKWAQLYEHINQKIDVIKSDDTEIEQVVKSVTGGKLKWGLSAAGHLDSDIFQFFQRYGISLMSGFGMTEATGGITMTPPGEYRPNSLGKALPGINLKIDSDGELLIKGPYVTDGYVNPEDSEITFLDGWLATGDIMRMSEDGFIQIIDRKKEIYKNLRGETIAPQKIENYFRDFEFIKHVFLVGDGRPFNTLLVYPDYDCEDIDFRKMSDIEIREYFGSVIVSVNRFLAGFERIVDFTIIDRDFEADRDELTPKGTFRRKVIEKNFTDVIEPMYQQEYKTVETANLKIIIPRWLFRDLNISGEEVQYKNGNLYFTKKGSPLTIRETRTGTRIGNFIYNLANGTLDLSLLLKNPALWLGNQQLVDFAGAGLYQIKHNFNDADEIEFRGMVPHSDVNPQDRFNLRKIADDPKLQFRQFHFAALMLFSSVSEFRKSALTFLIQASANHLSIVSELLKRSVFISDLDLQRAALLHLMEHLPDEKFHDTLMLFLTKKKSIINSDIINAAGNLKLNETKLQLLFDITQSLYRAGDKRAFPLLQMLVPYGASHPTRFKIIRHFMVDCQLGGDYQKDFSAVARKSQLAMRDGFRKWLGPTQRVAVDIESGEEYTWDDVITFEEGIVEADRRRLTAAIINTTLIREAVFLFSKGILIRLNDIPPGGVWISLLGRKHGKAVYRITVQTRFQGSYDIAVNVNNKLAKEDIISETNWLIQAGTTASGRKLVEDFGGYWPEYDLWSEEFIPGETAGKFIQQMSRRRNESDRMRLKLLWPLFIWSGATAYINFWIRTGKRLELKDPNPDNVIVPVHDYQTGSRIVAISSRRKHKKLPDLFLNLIRSYVSDTEEKYPELKGIGKPKYLFSAFIESLGAKDGVALLETCSQKLHDKSCKEIREQLIQYLDAVKEYGFLPKRLYFAIRRYQRWLELNNDATTQARAATLSELYDTYELNLLESDYPETRTRFFTNTVFKSANKALNKRLEAMINLQRSRKVGTPELTQHIAAAQQELDPNSDEVFFLTRLSYPHLKPTDSADFISLEAGGKKQTDIVIKKEDYDGNGFWIRTPVNPKEIARLQNLFVVNNLPVQFQSEHRYLIALNERGHLIGGLFYKHVNVDNAHMEKIVVTNHYRKKGVSDGILTEFFDRMHDEHIRYVTTGFFRPEYFYRFGFKTERKYAGLVKEL
jgi:long-subunit acyl-CoA synthetase (AMP-forming)